MGGICLVQVAAPVNLLLLYSILLQAVRAVARLEVAPHGHCSENEAGAFNASWSIPISDLASIDAVA